MEDLPIDAPALTASLAKSMAVQSRVNKIIEVIIEATKKGLFETQVEKLTPEQKEYLEVNGYKLREIILKSGSTYDINWE